VLMKLDPQSVAWTCAKCGAIVGVPTDAPPPASATPTRWARRRRPRRRVRHPL